MRAIKTEPIIPAHIDFKEISKNHLKISISPFEAGYAVTLAHPLKRILVSSSVGYAPVALKIQGVQHEFDSMRGVVEDVSAFIAHLKNIRFSIKDKNTESVEVHYDFTGPMVLHGKDLANSEVDVVSGDVYLATVNEGFSLSFSIIIKKGMGYVPSEDIRESTEEGYIPLDAFFTPVRWVNYEISNVLVEDNPNFEKVDMDIITDGQITPQEAFDGAIATMYKQMSIFGDKKGSCGSSKSSEDDAVLKVFLTPLSSIDLSARCFNCLDKHGLRYIGELILMKEDEVRKIKNMGDKSFDEIGTKLQELGYSIGAKLPKDTMDAFAQKLAKLKS